MTRGRAVREASAVDEREYVSSECRDLIAVFRRRTTAEMQVQHVHSQRLRVPQRLGDLFDRADDLPVVGFEERRADIDEFGQPPEVDGRARSHLVAVGADVVDAALHLRARSALRDPSIAPLGDPVDTHRALLGAGIAILEGIDLRTVDPGPVELLCLPIRLVGSDGVPARVLVRPVP